MEKISGSLRKLKGTLDSLVNYHFRLDDNEIPLADALGKKISLSFDGTINCIQCERQTKKSFQQGYCYPCYRRLMECNLCIIHPERCRVEEGGCPKDDWAHAHCHQEHIIYLANSSGLKVGITRETQVPTRWIDQGACQAIPIFKVQNRYQAGAIEVAMKSYVADKTNWRKMLKNDVEVIDMKERRDALLSEARVDIDKVIAGFSAGDVEAVNIEPINLEYPVMEYPTKVSSLSLDKQALIEGQLVGIKGQYLILDIGVLNIRKFGGYQVSFSLE
jgi:hypothetical protein